MEGIRTAPGDIEFRMSREFISTQRDIFIILEPMLSVHCSYVHHQIIRAFVALVEM